MTRLIIRSGQHVSQLSGRHSVKAYAPLFPHHNLYDGIYDSGEGDYSVHKVALDLFSFCEMFQLKPIANVGKLLGCDASRFSFPLAFSTPKGAMLVLDFPPIDYSSFINNYWDELRDWDIRSLGDHFGSLDDHDSRICARVGSGVDLQVICNALLKPGARD